jgi:hypothetical protein
VGVIAHHIISIGNGIMGDKEDDSLSLPVCVKCHAIVHAAHGTVIINQLWYLYQLIGLSVRNRELTGCTTDFSCSVIDTDNQFLTDFANYIRNAFASGEINLR